MKGKELIEVIKNNKLQEFEIELRLHQEEDSKWGFCIRTFNIQNKPDDIGYSSNKVIFGLIEID